LRLLPRPRRQHRRRRRGLRLTIGALLVIRLLLIANALVLAAVGGLYLVYGSGSGGEVAGGVLVGASVALFACLPLTDPYRRRR
jgi:hypothetical protein